MGIEWADYWDVTTADMMEHTREHVLVDEKVLLYFERKVYLLVVEWVAQLAASWVSGEVDSKDIY